jgi:hypothetical protein
LQACCVYRQRSWNAEAHTTFKMKRVRKRPRADAHKCCAVPRRAVPRRTEPRRTVGFRVSGLGFRTSVAAGWKPRFSDPPFVFLILPIGITFASLDLEMLSKLKHYAQRKIHAKRPQRIKRSLGLQSAFLPTSVIFRLLKRFGVLNRKPYEHR